MDNFDMQQYLQELLKEDPEGFQDTIRALNINPRDYSIEYKKPQREKITISYGHNQNEKALLKLKNYFIQETYLDSADSEEIEKFEELANLEERVLKNVIVAKNSSKKIIGAIWFTENYNDPAHGIDEEYAYLDKTFVLPKYRGQGIARRLQEAAEEQIEDGKLIVTDANENSKELFINSRYKVLGTNFQVLGNQFTTYMKRK